MSTVALAKVEGHGEIFKVIKKLTTSDVSIIHINMKDTFKYSCAEHDPDPKLIDVPYISYSLSESDFQRIKNCFNNGKIDLFQRATLIRDGQAFPEQGRWVYVGKEIKATIKK